MAISKDQKTEILNKVKGITEKDSVVFVNFKGLAVPQTSEMRQKLTQEGVGYYVAKKTLVRKAFTESSIEGEMPELEGELALASSDDLTAPAREVYAFQKQFDENISILGGVFEGRYMSKPEMEEIALIPGHDTLKGMFVNVINSPIQGFVMTLKALAEKKAA